MSLNVESFARQQLIGCADTHSVSVAQFLKGTHVVINARNEADVSPTLIMKRVEAASGANYSAHKEKPRKFEPITPVGTDYTPIGRPDIDSMRRGAPKDVVTPAVVRICYICSSI